MRHDVWELEPELREVSEWVGWMERELVPAGVDLPGASTCFKFSASSLRLALAVRRVYRHLPNALRSRLIEASLLHQCWQRSAGLSRKGSVVSRVQRLPVLKGRDFLGRTEGGHKLILASDGHEYAVRFPVRHRESALATEAICFEIAKSFGLPTAPCALLTVDDRLAACAGLPIERPGCPVQRRGMDELQPCLGVRRIVSIGTDDKGRPKRPLSARGRGLLVGAAILQVLVADLSAQEPCFVAPKGYAEPIFNDYSQCLVGADWCRFLKEDPSPPTVSSSVSRWVHSYQQLEHWIAKAECLDADSLCEMAVKLPSSWYGVRPLAMARVIERLHDRAMRLRHTVVHLVDAGYFPNTRRGPKAVRESTVFSRSMVAAAGQSQG